MDVMVMPNLPRPCHGHQADGVFDVGLSPGIKQHGHRLGLGVKSGGREVPISHVFRVVETIWGTRDGNEA